MYDLEMVNEQYNVAMNLRECRKLVEALAELDTAEKMLDEIDEMDGMVGIKESENALELRAGIYQGKVAVLEELGRKKEVYRMNEKIIKIRSTLKYDDKDLQDDSNTALALAYQGVGDLKKARAYANLVLDSSDSAEGYNAGMRC